jgi:hypothetical protein
MIAENPSRKQGAIRSAAWMKARDRVGTLRSMRKISRLMIAGLVGYGGYTLWNRYRDRLGYGSASDGSDDRRISARAGLTAAESAVGSDDPLAQAAAILTESDDRSQLPRDAPGIEHRHSEDTVER